ncbi:hypothetical protein BsWGS_09414 [Bradybaena similaris]
MTTQLCDYRLEIDAKKFTSECYFPGVTFDDFDRAGNVSPWKVCRLFEAGRAVPIRHGNYLDLTDLVKSGDSTYFVLGGNYYFEPCLWKIDHPFQYFPYKIKAELVAIGQTSFTIREILINLIDNKELASFICKLVYIDRKTRRPQSFPYQQLLKYQGIKSNDVKIDVPKSSAPDTAYTRQFIVTASDTDGNGHTNHAAYIRYCLDIAEQARRENRLRHFHSDICLYPITKMSTFYKGETLSGDTLRGSVWESDLDPSKLDFVISRGNDIAFAARIDFRDRPSSKL